MQFDLECTEPGCNRHMRLTVNTIQGAVFEMSEAGWSLGCRSRTWQEIVTDQIKAQQNGTLTIIPAKCKQHNPAPPKSQGIRISELIESLWKSKRFHGDLNLSRDMTLGEAAKIKTP